MRTYPITSDDGKNIGFEICHTWIWIGSIMRILRSVPGVSLVSRARGDDKRITFRLENEKFVVLEPFGDNSRYWIVPEAPGESVATQDELHQAFIEYRTPLVKYVIGKFSRSLA